MTERKPCLPTCEPKPKTSPTLAQLRKLAKRKGQTITGEDGIVKLVQSGTWWLKIVYGPLNILTGGTIVKDEREAKRVLRAALSALPDAPKPGHGCERKRKATR